MVLKNRHAHIKATNTIMHTDQTDNEHVDVRMQNEMLDLPAPVSEVEQALVLTEKGSL